MSGEQKEGILILVFCLLLFWQISQIAYRTASWSFLNQERSDTTAVLVTEQEEKSKKDRDYETEPKQVAFTFDDGPHPVYTEWLLDGLKERGIPATFFLIGENISGREELVKRMQEEGHLIGNHTFHHVQMAKEGPVVCGAELDMTNELIRSITGVTPSFIRPPYGQWNYSLGESISMIPVGWDVDPMDWNTNDAYRVKDYVLSHVKSGDTVLFHDVYASSVQAALMAADELLAQGFEFVTADCLILN